MSDTPKSTNPAVALRRRTPGQAEDGDAQTMAADRG